MNYSQRVLVLLSVLLYGIWMGLPSAYAQNEFPLKDGDTWVMVGDSLTSMQMHTQYFEAFCYARFPKWKFHFRNSGVGGDSIPDALARFDWDVAGWKPTVVSVELGMNDHRWPLAVRNHYIANMRILTDRIVGIGARPVIFSSSPINDGMPTTSPEGSKMLLIKYSAELRAFAAERKIPFADQFNALVNVWARNKPAELCFQMEEKVRNTLSIQGEFPGREHLAKWLESWEKSNMRKHSSDLTGAGGNPVHPSRPGQLTMTAALLMELKAPGLVSKATLDVKGKVADQTQCRISNVTAEPDGGLSFDRLDDSLPMPIPDSSRGALIVYPAIADLSQWVLTITGLKPGKYQVGIDGVNVAVVSSDELGKGWNMGLLEKGSVAEQCRKILMQVRDKERLVGKWRQQAALGAGLEAVIGGMNNCSGLRKKVVGTTNIPDANSLRVVLEKLNSQILEADAKIRETAHPQSHHFVVAPFRTVETLTQMDGS